LLKFIAGNFGRKITFSYLVIFVTAFVAVAFYASRTLQNERLSEVSRSLTTQALLIGRTLPPGLIQSKNRSEIHKMVKSLGEATEARITVIAPEGLVLGDSKRSWKELLEMDNHAGRPEIRAALEGKTGSSIRYSNTLKTEMLYVAIPIHERDGEVLGVLRVAFMLTAVDQVLLSIRRPIFVGASIGILFSVVLGFWLGRSIAKRVRAMKKAAVRYATGDLTRKIPAQPDDELGALGETMNQMAKTLADRIGEIKEERNRFSSVLDNMAEGVIAVDCEKRILMINPSAEAMFDIRKESVFGKGMIETVRSKALDDMLAQAIQKQCLITGELELPRPVARVLRVNAVGISKCRDTICGILVVSDISELRRLERSRQEFVANVSHELKTPLTSVRGFIEILQGDAGTDEARRGVFLKMMEKDSDRLTRLIDDLLELSKIESGELSLKLTPVNLEQELSEAMSLFGARAAERKIALEHHMPQRRPLYVLADRDRLRQILINLIDNAVKFNRDGGRVAAGVKETENDQVRVSIEDTGQGIPAESIPRIFERFYRVDKARSRELGGTGLGLSIVKHLVEAHGGTVSCKSVPQSGSTFSFTLRKANPS